MVTLSRSLRRTINDHRLARTVLLGCGVVSSVWYVVTDIIGALRYEGYSYADQVFSELTAAGSPTRPLMVMLNGIPYSILVTAFSIGVATSARPPRTAKVTGTLLAGYATTGMLGGVVFPMPARGTDGTWQNMMHIPATALMSVCVLSAMGSGSRLDGRPFRLYSYGTIATLLVFGGLTSLQGPQVAANEATPWVGIEERVNIYATMLWLSVLAVILLRTPTDAALRPTGRLQLAR